MKRGSPARRRLDVDSRRQELLEIGREFFFSRPYDEVWIDDIASAAGVSKGLLYHYFPSKREFFAAALRAEAEQMQASTQPRTDLPPEEQLRGSLDVYLDYVEGHADAYRAVFRSGSGVDPEVAAIIKGYDESQVTRLHEILTGGKPSETLRLALHGWIGFNRAVALDWLEGKQIARDDLRELMVHGLSGAVQAAQQVEPGLQIGPPPPEPDR